MKYHDELIGLKFKLHTWLTLLSGDTSTACRLTVPARPIRVESSLGPELMMAVTRTCRGFCNQSQSRHHNVSTLKISMLRIAQDRLSLINKNEPLLKRNFGKSLENHILATVFNVTIFGDWYFFVMHYVITRSNLFKCVQESPTNPKFRKLGLLKEDVWKLQKLQ